ncbi:MAG: DUF2797 domain-containing protein [Thermogladius sp.]|nr:DUF2797 domain-containing protein [Thermogladius sp.]
MILRLVYFEPKPLSTIEIPLRDLHSFLSASGAENKVVLEEFRVGFKGLVLQPVGSEGVTLVERGGKVRLREPGLKYCLWHSGSLSERDNPLERRYCTQPAQSSQGFCPRHIKTPRAIYTLCFTTGGEGSLEYCKMLDSTLGGEGGYVVYIVAFRGRVKVGSTRYWRFNERLAEQPHSLGSIVFETNSSYQARSMELKIGRIEGFAEHLKADFKDLVNPPIVQDANTLLINAKKLRRAGFDLKPIEPRRIVPDEKEVFKNAVERRVSDVIDVTLELVGYYSGYILLYNPGQAVYVAVKASQLLQTDSVTVVD